MLQVRDKGCDIDVTYAGAIALWNGDSPEAEFGPEIWAEHGEAIIQEGKATIYFMHIYGLANHPLAQFLDGADAYVSCEIERRDGLADRFASLDEYPVRSAEQRRHEGAHQPRHPEVQAPLQPVAHRTRRPRRRFLQRNPKRTVLSWHEEEGPAHRLRRPDPTMDLGIYADGCGQEGGLLTAARCD